MYQPPYQQVTKRGANHALHITLSFITCGLWLPVWAIAAMMGRKTVTEVRPPAAPQYPMQHPYPQYGPPQTPPPGYGHPQQPPYPPR